MAATSRNPIAFLLYLWCAGCTANGSGPTTDARVDSGAAQDATPLQGHSWIQITGNGFGQPTLNTVPELEVFKDQIYVSLAPKDQGDAMLLRSSTGEAGDWQDVTPPLDKDKSIHSFGTTDLGGGMIWCATGAQGGAMVFASADGKSWTPIAHRGFGTPDLRGATPHMVVYQGSADNQPYLYAGAGSHGGSALGQVWRIPFASTDPYQWQLLVDFADPALGTNNVSQITYFYVWKNTLYFGVNGGGMLWQSTDGTSFTEVPEMETGFGNTNNTVVASLVEFKGFLYASTTNFTDGGQLWRTADGKTWTALTTDAFGKGKSTTELRSLRTSFGKLWLTAYTDVSTSSGTPVWYSDDGESFTQSNSDGFGDKNNSGQNAVTIGFGKHQYFGGPNYVTGGQVWRAEIGVK
jgi:hypothetical protein